MSFKFFTFFLNYIWLVTGLSSKNLLPYKVYCLLVYCFNRMLRSKSLLFIYLHKCVLFFSSGIKHKRPIPTALNFRSNKLFNFFPLFPSFFFNRNLAEGFCFYKPHFTCLSFLTKTYAITEEVSSVFVRCYFFLSFFCAVNCCCLPRLWLWSIIRVSSSNCSTTEQHSNILVHWCFSKFLIPSEFEFMLS